MNVIVQPGFAMCNGCMKLEESQRTLVVQASNTTYDRIDTVVLRLDDNVDKRICDFYIVQGTPATSPIRPELTRTESIWEIGLADLFIAKNSTAISNQRITDTRYETSRCGVISSISEFDTTTLYQQIQADLEEFQNVSEADFLTWFENIKVQLSGDVAGNLQNQINDEVEERQQAVEELNNKIGVLANLKTSVKTNIVNAINTLFDTVKKISDGYVSGVRGGSESSYRKGNVTITKANIGLGNVDNTKDADKRVKYAETAGSATIASNCYEAAFASANVLRETSMKNQPLVLGETYQFKPEDTDEEGNRYKAIRTSAPGSFLVVRIGIQTGAWTIKNVIIPFPPSESGGVSVVGFNHYEGNFYKGILRWKPSDGMLEGELTGVSDGWANSIKIIDLWIFNCEH